MRGWVPLLLLAFSILALGGEIAAGAGIDVVCLTPTRTVEPQSVTTLSFRVTNQGDSPERFDVTVELPPGFSVLFAPREVEVMPGEAEVVLVSLFVSALAPAGDHEVVLRVRSASDPSRYATATAVVSVLPKAGVELRLPTGARGWPGAKVTYRIWIVNRGNAPDSFSIEVKSGWRWGLSQPLVHLMPGEVAEVTLTLLVPPKAKIGDKNYCTIIVRSTLDPEVSDKGGFWTTVGPPPPEEVPVTFFPLVPVSIGFAGRWRGIAFSSVISLDVGGMIAPERYLFLKGSVQIDVEGLSFTNVGVKYREANWGVWVGKESLEDACLCPESSDIDICYSYHPAKQPFSATLCWQHRFFSMQFRYRLSNFLLGLYFKETEGLTLFVASEPLPGSSETEASGLGTSFRPFLWKLSWGERKEFSFRGALTPFSVKFSYTFDETYAKTEGKLGLTTSFGGLGFKLSGEVKRERDIGLDTLGLKFEIGFLSNRRRPFYWSFSDEFASYTDYLSGTMFNTITIRGELSTDTVPSLSLKGELTYRGTGAFTSFLELATDFSLPGDLTGEIKWSPFGRRGLHVSLRALDFTLTLEKRPDLLELGVTARFRALLPLIETMGQIEGVVFIDEDLDGVRDPGERGVANILLKADDEQAVTDEDGFFRFRPMYPGIYKLTLLTPPQEYSPWVPLPLEVRVSAGKVERVEIALVPNATLSGRVIVYRPVSLLGYQEPEKAQLVADRPLPGAKVIITDGVQTFVAVTDVNGAFFFRNLRPGTWELRVEIPELAPPHYVEKDVYTITLEPGEHYQLEVRVLPKPRVIQPLNPPAP